VVARERRDRGWWGKWERKNVGVRGLGRGDWRGHDYSVLRDEFIQDE
jgi:hypothetical protein